MAVKVEDAEEYELPALGGPSDYPPENDLPREGAGLLNGRHDVDKFDAEDGDDYDEEMIKAREIVGELEVDDKGSKVDELIASVRISHTPHRCRCADPKSILSMYHRLMIPHYPL